ncbi:hypothetical protein GCM10023186_44330 [Hymenobacter koreensis]|uniref:Uncharacterized protein n=1 Tax=Hymenobacter koreensis TaxID=1084523 RepID=A0ABP8JMJ0_9BACT
MGRVNDAGPRLRNASGRLQNGRPRFGDRRGRRLDARARPEDAAARLADATPRVWGGRGYPRGNPFGRCAEEVYLDEEGGAVGCGKCFYFDLNELYELPA